MKRSVVVVLIIASVLVVGALAMRGRAASLLHRWMPALHGGR
jgi:hypothetical protein